MDGNPDLVIQVILATVLVITGTYVAGPWYIGGTTTAVGVTLDSNIARIAAGSFYLFSGSANLFGITKDSEKWRYWGTLATFLSFTFMTLLRLFTFGLTPIVWLIILALALIAGIMHLRESRRTDAHG